MAPPPLVIAHIPHASTVMPSLEGFVGDWRGEVDLLTDWATDEIFAIPQAVTVAAPFSRVFCDVERYDDDAVEPMASVGMGFIYTQTDQGLPLRTVTDDLRQRIRAACYQPHHQRLAGAVANGLAAGRQVVLIDGHSFADTPFRRDLDQSRPRPDLCLGTDPTWSDPSAVAAMVAVGQQAGFRVACDAPYRGTMVPAGIERMHQLNGACFHAYMIELNRRLYMDGLRVRPGAIRQMQSLVVSLVDACLGRLNHL